MGPSGRMGQVYRPTFTEVSRRPPCSAPCGQPVCTTEGCIGVASLESSLPSSQVFCQLNPNALAESDVEPLGQKGHGLGGQAVMLLARVFTTAKSGLAFIDRERLVIATTGGRSRHGLLGTGCPAPLARPSRCGQRAITVSRGLSSTVLQGQGHTPMAGSIGRTSAGSRLSGLGRSAVSGDHGSSNRSISISTQAVCPNASLESAALVFGCRRGATTVVLVPSAVCKAPNSSIAIDLAGSATKIATISHRFSQVCLGQTTDRITKRLTRAEITASKACQTAKVAISVSQLVVTGLLTMLRPLGGSEGRFAKDETEVLFSVVPSNARPF